MIWLCKIFGHKFIKCKGGYVHQDGYCYRCGIEAKHDK